MATFVLTCYFSILAVLCVYGFHRIEITRAFVKNTRKKTAPPERFETLPKITVQLPVFNEKFVIKRIIEAAAALDYPRDRLQIQVLDDSTDETVALAAECVGRLHNLGVDIEHIHRVDRVGYKAGALEHGMRSATGELIAIFDADFIPEPDMLQRMVHHFTDRRVGVVQARWAHLNRDTSTLTQIQAMMLDAHFMIEHGGRCASGRFFNFNGTAGIWRREAIDDAGGWLHDTLTEDLDLSYRAQMKGWRFVFLPEVGCPSELPEDMSAFKSQQHRWAKGSIQVMRKVLLPVLRAPLPFKVKWEAYFHLSGNLAYLLMVINSVFFVIPSMMYRYDLAWWKILFIDGPLFLMASLSFVYFYLTAQKALFGRVKGKKRLVPALMAIGIGLGVNNAKAVLEALFGHRSGFVRTPKAGVTTAGQSPKKGGYRLPKSGWGYIELTLGLMYTAAIVWAVFLGNWASIPFLVLFQNGFLYIGWSTVSEQWANRKADRASSEPDLKAA